MKKIKKINLSMLIISISFIVTGILMYRFPMKVIDLISYIIAASIALLALKYIWAFIKKEEMILTYKLNLVIGIILMIAAIVVAYEHNFIKVILVYLIGIFIIIGGAMKIETAFYLRKKSERFVPILVVAIICIIFGILVLQIPMNVSDSGGSNQVGERAIMILGIIMAVTGLIDFIYTLASARKEKAYKDEEKLQKIIAGQESQSGEEIQKEEYIEMNEEISE